MGDLRAIRGMGTWVSTMLGELIRGQVYSQVVGSHV